MNWAKQAACIGQPVEWWFPKRGATRAGRGGYSHARPICQTCPVRNHCLNEALNAEGHAKAPHRAGMFGGLTPGERADLRPAFTVNVNAPFYNLVETIDQATDSDTAAA
jgi:hypothetical protein